MNGRMAKQLRRVAANPSIPAETAYTGVKHNVVMYRPLKDERGLQVYQDGKMAYEPVGVTRIQVVLKRCQRQAYKAWKHRYRHFAHRGNTLPNVGLNHKHIIR